MKQSPAASPVTRDLHSFVISALRLTRQPLPIVCHRGDSFVPARTVQEEQRGTMSGRFYERSQRVVQNRSSYPLAFARSSVVTLAFEIANRLVKVDDGWHFLGSHPFLLTSSAFATSFFWTLSVHLELLFSFLSAKLGNMLFVILFSGLDQSY